MHFWQGEWINDQELNERLKGLSSLSALAQPLSTELVLHAADELSKALKNASSEVYQGLSKTLLESQAIGFSELSSAFAEISDALSKETLEKKLKRELGSKRPFQIQRITYEEQLFEAWSPLGLLIHISPQNSFATGPMSVLEGLLSGNVNFLKTGRDESLFPQLFLEALCKCDPSGKLSQYVIAAKISSKDTDRLTQIFSAADGIAAWGGEDSIGSIRKMAPPHVRIVEWGHRISYIYVAFPFDKDPETLERIAREVCLNDQQACASPQCVYLDTDHWEEINRFGEALARALERISQHYPKSEPEDAAAAEISMVSLCHELESSYGKARVIYAQDGSWRLFLDERSPLTASPLYRSLWIKPLPRKRIIEVLRPMRRYQQTVGLACSMADVYELTQSLLMSGATRIRQIGAMLGSYAGEPHDSLYSLQRYCRRVSVQLDHSAKGISGFDELTRYAMPAHLVEVAKIALTPKEEFTAPDTNARYYFRSGGSSGKPKLSTFSLEQYDDDMRFGAEGIYSAGLDPVHDRTMNLFFSGGLYGGFLSIFSALERLGAIQFPMAAYPDLVMVAQTIIDQKVNTLLGMPSYLMSVFDKNAAILEEYRGIKKIFYGGEHFTSAQREYLMKRFGVEVIRSGAYGSVDIGPMGYQCRYCEDGVHHLQQRLHFLEILKMDSDEPVSGQEAGRLVFTPRDPGSNKPKRYVIGDVGHWVQDQNGHCPCGRSAPKFKLLGRTGDIFRIGSIFLNYQKFAQILSTHSGYVGDLQIRLLEDGIKEKLELRVGQSASLSADEYRKICLQNYPELSEAVLQDKVLQFEARSLVLEEFERSKASGKLLRIIDQRRRE